MAVLHRPLYIKVTYQSLKGDPPEAVEGIPDIDLPEL